MNSLASCLGNEEPEVTSVSIRPGMVDTDMQRELRDVHSANMDPETHSKFTNVHKDGKLLQPEQPGHVMAKLVLNAPKELSGKFLSYVSPRLYPTTRMLTKFRWNDKELEVFQ